MTGSTQLLLSGAPRSVAFGAVKMFELKSFDFSSHCLATHPQKNECEDQNFAELHFTHHVMRPVFRKSAPAAKRERWQKSIFGDPIMADNVKIGLVGRSERAFIGAGPARKTASIRQPSVARDYLLGGPPRSDSSGDTTDDSYLDLTSKALSRGKLRLRASVAESAPAQFIFLSSRPSPRPMISSMISLVPAKMRLIRASVYMRLIRYSSM